MGKTAQGDPDHLQSHSKITEKQIRGYGARPVPVFVIREKEKGKREKYEKGEMSNNDVP